jgi:hypothetical protein
MCIPTTDSQMSNRRRATWARLPSAFKNIAAMLRLSLSPKQIPLCAAKRDSFCQYFLNCGMQAGQFALAQRSRGAPRINASQPKTFVSVAIAKPGQDALVQ